MIYRSKNTALKRRQNGIGLIEILVAVMLLSIGFLAAAQMQIQGMRFSQGAYFQSQAYFMISDMMDRMRGNYQGVVGLSYSNQSTSGTRTNPNCSTTYCSSAEIAAQDLFDWSANLHNLRQTTNFTSLLPGTETQTALGQIIARPNGVFGVGVVWYEKIGDQNVQQSLMIDFVP